MGELTNIKTIVQSVAKNTATDAAKAVGKTAPASTTATSVEPKIKRSEFFTGAIVRGNENSLGQAPRHEYINEFIDFWTGDYRAKAKCLCFLAIAFLTFNIMAPFALFCVALAAKYWDLAMWNRNISRFNGHFRTVIYGL